MFSRQKKPSLRDVDEERESAITYALPWNGVGNRNLHNLQMQSKNKDHRIGQAEGSKSGMNPINGEEKWYLVHGVGLRALDNLLHGVGNLPQIA